MDKKTTDKKAEKPKTPPSPNDKGKSPAAKTPPKTPTKNPFPAGANQPVTTANAKVILLCFVELTNNFRSGCRPLLSRTPSDAETSTELW